MNYIPIEPDAWVLVQHYSDGSAMLGAIGPFATQDEAKAANHGMGVLAGEIWTPVPLRIVRQDIAR